MVLCLVSLVSNLYTHSLLTVMSVQSHKIECADKTSFCRLAWSHLTYNVHSYGIVARIHCMHACSCSVFIVVDDSAFVSDDELAVLTKKDFLQNDELY